MHKGMVILYAGRPTAGVTRTLVSKAVKYTNMVLNVYYLNDERNLDNYSKLADLQKAGPGRLVITRPRSREMEGMIADIRLAETNLKTMFQVVIFDLALPHATREDSPYNSYRDSTDKVIRFSREEGRIVLVSYRIRANNRSERMIDNLDFDLAISSDEIYWVKKTHDPELKVEVEKIKG